MNILSKLKGIFSRDEPEERTALTRDIDGRLIYSDTFVSDIKAELERRKRDRFVFEQHWKLCTNFLNDHQFCDVNPVTQKVEDYPETDEYSERNVFNRIAPIMATRQASLNNLKYNMTVKPRTGDIDDLDKAAVSTKLLRYTADSLGFDKLVHDAVSWAEVLGTAFICSYWNTRGGRELARLSEIEIESGAVNEESVHEGALGCGLLSAYEVFPSDLYKQDVKDQRSIIVEQIMSRDEIYDSFGVVVPGSEKQVQTVSGVEANNVYGMAAMAFTMNETTKPDSESVITYYERPSRLYPDGRMAVIIADELIWYSPLPYDEIPIVALKSEIVPGQFFGRSVIRRLIPLQRSYNGCKNKIHDYLKAITTGKDYIEEGSVDIDEYIAHGHEPGYPVIYKRGHDRPAPRQNDSMPNELFNEVASLERAMEYAAGVSQLMVFGATPSGLTSGAALESLREIDESRLSLVGDNIRDACLAVAKMWLSIYKRYAHGYRVIEAVGKSDSGRVTSWCRDDITSFDVYVTNENELRESEAAQKQRFMEALGAGLFTDSNGQISRRFKARAIEAMKLGSYDDISNIDELQAQNARNENSDFVSGILPAIGDFDDHELHFEEHLRFALSSDYKIMEKKTPEYAKAFKEHLQAHFAAGNPPENNIRKGK